ncbi:MAG: hypothetical protein QF441_00305 [Bacteriovoracaceae bacterium]|jgi:hypothetical protein|nr:hypothetical protein [Halobacteriovoraceae bacterium]MDP7319011.1 hypothetical protein [Bacteriovoracaceae bacterium]|tara:strand:- start:462 stop:1022 length:561 start_codon:yes stop_codon:yes gene_type:complete
MKKGFLFSFLFLWFCSIFYLIANMHGFHLISFKNSETEKNIKLEPIQEQWGLVHILAEGCGCSEIIADYLLKRKPQKNLHEQVLLLGETQKYATKLNKSGYKVKISQELNGYIDGVPMLLIHNKAGEIKYSGGYAKTMVTPITKIQDLKILKQIQSHISTEKLAVMGCAVSKKLQKEIDPLGLKYN